MSNINQQIANAAKLVQHAAAELIYKDEFGKPMTPTIYDRQMAGVYVQTFLSIDALASNALSIAHAHIKLNDYHVSEAFIPLSEEACENETFHELFLRYFYCMSDTLSETVTSKESLLFLLGDSIFKTISFDEITVNVPCQDIINFCEMLPNGSKIKLKVIKPEESVPQTELLYLFCELSDTTYVEQITRPIAF